LYWSSAFQAVACVAWVYLHRALCLRCVKCKLALHGLAAYLLNSLQQCSSLQSRRKQRWRLFILLLRKITN